MSSGLLRQLHKVTENVTHDAEERLSKGWMRDGVNGLDRGASRYGLHKLDIK